MPNSANNESLNITDEVIKKSATIKAYTRWKKNTSYSEDIKNKVEFALKNNLKVIFCIGENKSEKKKKQTINVLKKQIKNALNKKYDFKKIIIAYEPIWSIGSGKLPSKHELSKIVLSLKKFLNSKFNKKHKFKILYGGSVDSNSIYQFKKIKELDGFLIGGASKSSKKFIDIIKNFYK